MSILRDLYRNLLVPGAIRDIASGEASNWTFDDWYAALVKFPIVDMKHIAVQIILNHTGDLGRSVVTTVLLRRTVSKMKAMRSEYWCVYHDCDSKQCPAGSHEDD